WLARGTLGVAFALAAMVLGALMFVGALVDDHYAAWPGWIGGVVCAVVVIAATRPLLACVRGRLDRTTAATVFVYTEGSAVLFLVLSIVAPLVGLIALAGLLWLLIAGRWREGQKYAGLWILW